MNRAELHQLALSALMAHGASLEQAEPTVNALIRADEQGLTSHGLSRIPMYCAHLKYHRVLGTAQPRVVRDKPSTVLVSAENGFAFPACALALDVATSKAKSAGMAMAAVFNSHHFGAAGLLLEPLAEKGLIGIAMGNSPSAMPYPGGKRAVFGTNPIAAIFPRAQQKPLIIDLSLSEVARGKIMIAAKNNTPIPLGWALDSEGQPTTDPHAALKGSMLPFGSMQGGTKGAMLALMIELLVITLSGAHFGAEADSFFEDQGNQPKIGQLFLVIDPEGMAGSAVYHERMESLISFILADNNGEIRLPGSRRLDLAERAKHSGINLPQALLEQITALAIC